MKWLVIGLIIIFLLVILIILTKLTIILSYQHSKDDDNLNLTFKAWFGLITYKISIPLIKIDKNSPAIVIKEETQTGNEKEHKEESVKKLTAKELVNRVSDIKELLNHVVSMHRIVRAFLRRVSLKRFEWHSAIGVGDAALTGTLIGALWAVKGGILGILSHYMILKEMPVMSISPSFQKAISQTRVQCMIQFRIGYAMLAGIKLVKYWKGGKPKFQSEPLKFVSKDKSNSV